MFRLLVPLIALSAAAQAELRWERPVQEFERSPEDGHVSTTFPFQNVGPVPVTIRSVKSSCGCTTADLAKRTYAPAERGEVVAKFVFGGRIGPHRKIITVKTDDGAAPTILDLRVMLREHVTVAPTLIYWKVGEPNVAKYAQITTRGGAITVKSVTSSNPRLIPHLETVIAGEQYIVSITPVDTAQKQSGKVEVLTDMPDDKLRVYPIYVRIK